MHKIFIDTNILVEFARKGGEQFKTAFLIEATNLYPKLNKIWISDLVFNETHAFLTNKIDIDSANMYLKALFKPNPKAKFSFELCYHRQFNHSQALIIASNPSYRDESKGLTMVDSLLLLQMTDEDGLIFTGDKRMSFYFNDEPRQVAHYYSIK